MSCRLQVELGKQAPNCKFNTSGAYLNRSHLFKTTKKTKTNFQERKMKTNYD